MDHIILQYAWDRLPATVLALGLPKIATVNVLYANVIYIQNVLLYNIKKCGMSNSYYLQQMENL